MPNKFEATDPHGRHVTCTEEAWEHIIGNRPWMDTEAWKRDIKRAIENPTMGIYQDVDFDDRHIYYMFRIQGKHRHLKVVVQIEGAKTGSIVTAYPTFNLKAGEKLI